MNEKEVHDGDSIIGWFTENEFYNLRKSQCFFHTPTQLQLDDMNKVLFVGSSNIPENCYVCDRFIEFDIQFQHYILSMLPMKGVVYNKNTPFNAMIHSGKNSYAVPIVENGWNFTFS